MGRNIECKKCGLNERNELPVFCPCCQVHDQFSTVGGMWLYGGENKMKLEVKIFISNTEI